MSVIIIILKKTINFLG